MNGGNEGWVEVDKWREIKTLLIQTKNVSLSWTSHSLFSVIPPGGVLGPTGSDFFPGWPAIKIPWKHHLPLPLCVLYVLSNNYTDRQHISHAPKTYIFPRPLKKLKFAVAFHLKIINWIVFWRRFTPLVLIYSREKRRIKGFWQSFFCHIFVLGSPETPPPFFPLPFHSPPSLLLLREVKKASTESL